MISSIAVVGAGPRGLSILERIAATMTDRRLRVHLIDPGPVGVGVHREDQPEGLLLNTVAGQITMFRRGDPAADGVCIDGPSLAEWAGVPRDAYLPRRALGAYLRDAYTRLREGMPEGVDVVEHHARAVAIAPDPGGGWELELSQGERVQADFAVLATGHGALSPSAAEAAADAFVQEHRARNPALAHLRSCYPLESLAAIAPGARVAVRGMGLAAVDVVLLLTAGRGGRFTPSADGLVYHPSGQEPQLTVWSRHGRAFWPRARNEKSPSDVHHPIRLDLDRIHALRATGPRDFAVDHVPLLIAEMTAAAQRIDPRASVGLLAQLLRFPDDAEGGNAHDRAASLLEFFREDEARAEAGNMTDPLKAATDAIRDLRNEIRECVEHGGLDAASHRRFVEVYAPLLHVMSAGPPAQRAREWRALIAAGVLRLGPADPQVEFDAASACFRLRGADDAMDCDVIVGASVDPFLPERDDAPLTRSLLEGGLARPYRNGTYHPGGWDIDTAGRLIDAAGRPQPNLCAVGNPTEGPHYFTNMLPAPGLPSRITEDARRVIDAVAAYERAGDAEPGGEEAAA
ncbi:FAD/NAD(P)-binding protein [Microbacterium sp.]|uniref:FAD/NAD(P)-binding protein n=1 Tax=Microbacterium sp. TaxID=51671 RepID=UPI0037C5790F